MFVAWLPKREQCHHSNRATAVFANVRGCELSLVAQAEIDTGLLGGLQFGIRPLKEIARQLVVLAALSTSCRFGRRVFHSRTVAIDIDVAPATLRGWRRHSANERRRPPKTGDCVISGPSHKHWDRLFRRWSPGRVVEEFD